MMVSDDKLPVHISFEANMFFDTNINKRHAIVFFFLKSEFEGWFKEAKCGAKFISLSFMIKDGNNVINLSELD